MTKKVAILTFHRTTNFGSALQTYGLYKKICDLGYSCEVLDYTCEAVEKREKVKIVIDLSKPRITVRNILYGPHLQKKGKKLSEFVQQRMTLSAPYTKKNIHDSNEVYSKFVVGSDIVWGRDITQDDYTYFLDFVNQNNKKYAFSSSVGDYEIRENEDNLAELLRRFSRIAVREKEAIQWVYKISGKNSEFVCDPTMLLTLDEWENAIKPKVYYGDYVLVYFNNGDGKCLSDAITYAKFHNKRVLLFNYFKPVHGVENIKPTSLEEFLGLIKYASMVFTASYHGMLFSIYNHKQFMFYTRAHKSRVLSLANQLKVLECCGDEKNIENYELIDYEKVDSALQEFRFNSIQILREMLEE